MLANDSIAGDEDDNRPRASALTRIPVDLAELDRERIHRGWSKQDLAAAADLSTKTVSLLYRDAEASPAVYRKLKAALVKAAPSEMDGRLVAGAAEGAA